MNVQIVDEPEAGGQSLVELQGRGGDGIVERSGVGREVGHDVGGDDGERRGRVTIWWMSIIVHSGRKMIVWELTRGHRRR